MQEQIERLLQLYPTARASTSFKGPHEVQREFQSLQADIENIAVIKSNPNLMVKYSYGKGNWAAVPWIAILDSRETTTTQDGTYIVLLFSEDGSACFCKLAQGVTAVKNSLGAKRATIELGKRAADVRSLFPEMENSRFETSGDARLGADKGVAKLYDASTIFSESWRQGEIPSDGYIQDSLCKLVEVYTRYVDQQLNNARDAKEGSDLADERRIWAISAGEGGRLWPKWLEQGVVSIGWNELGNLTAFADQAEITEKLQSLRDDETRPYNSSLACFQFVKEIKIGDIVIAKAGRKKVFGMGIVTSEFCFEQDLEDHRNRRKVDWLKTEPTEFPGSGIALKTLTELTMYRSCVDLVNNYLDIEPLPAPDEEEGEDAVVPQAAYSIESILAEGCFLSDSELRDIIDILKRKRNLILQGPPGTGKTWLAKRLAYALIGRKEKSRVRSVQFHPNLSYEDFVRGWRPSGEGKLALVDGAFMEAIEDAKNTSHPHVIVVEEINRGNPAQIFGEMLTLLEADKRRSSDALELSYRRYPDERVYIPPNLYVIGTMNVADRSLALVDMALRRRFAFFDMRPLFNEAWKSWLQDEFGFERRFIDNLATKVESLNLAITEDPSLGAQYRVGHSYFTPPSDTHVSDPNAWLLQVVKTELGPLIEEYWFDDPEMVSQQISALQQ